IFLSILTMPGYVPLQTTIVSNGEAYVTAVWILVNPPPEGATMYWAPDTPVMQSALMSSTAEQQKRANDRGLILNRVLFWIIFLFINRSQECGVTTLDTCSKEYTEVM